MLVVKRSAGVAPEMNLWELISCMPPPCVNKAADSGFETQRRCHQKSKTGVSCGPRRGHVSTKNFKRKFTVGPDYSTRPRLNVTIIQQSKLIPSTIVLVLVEGKVCTGNLPAARVARPCTYLLTDNIECTPIPPDTACTPVIL